MDSISAWFAQLEFEKLWVLLITAASALTAISFHETCHGLAALALGDRTALNAGRLSLNPLRHIDPFGLLLLITVRFGWAKPVPVNMRNFKHPKAGMAITALAGPMSNVVLTALCLMGYAVSEFYYRLNGGEALYWLSLFLIYTATVSAGLAVFNLLPVPPLDGSKILFAVIPARWYVRLMRYERYGTFLLMGLLFLGVLDGPLDAMRSGLLDGLSRVCFWPFDLLVSIYF